MQRGKLDHVTTTDRGLELTTSAKQTLRIEVIAPSVIRVRRDRAGTFPEPALVRYGFVRDDWPSVQWQHRRTASGITLTTAALRVKIASDPVRVTIQQGRKTLLAETSEPFDGPAGGFGARFVLRRDDAFFGLGDQTRQRIEHRGARADMWIVNVHRYTPIPMVYSTRGVGLFVNTTFRHAFDLGATSPDWYGFEGDEGYLDYYVIAAATPAEFLDGYTQITGRPTPPPIWSFGLWFVCRTQADAKEMLDDCLNFRREGIPCDVIGLEPGWMEKNYDYSVEKTWRPERFPIPPYAPKGPHNFLDAARRMGFKPSLWLCNDYDLSIEEERRLAPPKAAEPGGDELGHDEVEQDQHFTAAKRLDTLTRPDEPWFEHLKHFIDQGVELFKQDGALQVLPHPDRKWANGMDDAEMHNLYPLLYSKQMHLGFREHTGRRATCFTPCGWAGLQRYTGTWSGDTGGGPEPLVSLLNLGASGHSLTTVDMEVASPEGIHFGFLQPWAQVNSWNYWRHPWLLGDDLKPIFKAYAELRYRLIPYLYSTAIEAYRTGMPMLRPMPLAFPDDRRTYNLLGQYMLGPAFLTAAFADGLYVPEGKWFDYWTGESLEGPQEASYSPPAGRGGPLLARAGAIVPLWPVMDYVGQRPVEVVTLEAFPGAAGAFTLYEDDGTTYAFENGAVAETRIECEPHDDGVVVRVGRRDGSYEGMGPRPAFELQMRLPEQPTRVRVNDRTAKAEPTICHGQTSTKAWRLTVGSPAVIDAPITFDVRWSRPRRPESS